MADERPTSGADDLDQLSRKLSEIKASREAGPQGAVDRSGMSLGLRLASEFASAILVGGLLGYGIDYLAGTSPWVLLAGLGFGFAAGTVNLVRASREHAAKHPAPAAATKAGWDDEDE